MNRVARHIGATSKIKTAIPRQHVILLCLWNLTVAFTRAVWRERYTDVSIFMLLVYNTHVTLRFQRIESPLENLQQGDNWKEMCTTTLADFRGLHFSGPHYCAHWASTSPERLYPL